MSPFGLYEFCDVRVSDVRAILTPRRRAMCLLLRRDASGFLPYRHWCRARFRITQCSAQVLSALSPRAGVGASLVRQNRTQDAPVRAAGSLDALRGRAGVRLRVGAVGHEFAGCCACGCVRGGDRRSDISLYINFNSC